MKTNEKFKVGDVIIFKHDYPTRMEYAKIIQILDKGMYNMYLCQTRNFKVCLRSEEMEKIKKKEGDFNE